MRFTGMLLSNADGTEFTLRLCVQDQQEYEITLSAEMAHKIMLALGQDALHLRGENTDSYNGVLDTLLGYQPGRLVH